MINNLAHINYGQHSVHLAKNTATGSIVCFKYNDRRCDLRVFDRDQSDQCAEYMLQAIPAFGWGFVEDSEAENSEQGPGLVLWFAVFPAAFYVDNSVDNF